MIESAAISGDRFRRARFDLVGGPTVLVTADDLQRAVETTVPVRLMCSLRIDLERSTINDQPVHFQVEV